MSVARNFSGKQTQIAKSLFVTYSTETKENLIRNDASFHVKPLYLFVQKWSPLMHSSKSIYLEIKVFVSEGNEFLTFFYICSV